MQQMLLKTMFKNIIARVGHQCKGKYVQKNNDIQEMDDTARVVADSEMNRSCKRGSAFVQ